MNPNGVAARRYHQAYYPIDFLLVAARLVTALSE